MRRTSFLVHVKGNRRQKETSRSQPLTQVAAPATLEITIISSRLGKKIRTTNTFAPANVAVNCVAVVAVYSNILAFR